MTAAESPSVLQRMATVAAPAVAEVPLTASRAVKLALTRGAEQAIGLKLTVETVTEEAKAFDPLLAALNDDLVLIWLDQKSEHSGLLAMDKEMSTAIVEMRTLGRVRDTPAPDRRPTGADIALAHPMFTAFLDELDETTGATVLDGWTTGIHLGDRVPTVRAASLALPENMFRFMALQVDLGAGDRKGLMWIALPDAKAAPKVDSDPIDTADWAKEMEETVMESPVVLKAILHRSKFPLSLLADLSVGQEIPLPGCSVSSVKLEALDNAVVARGRIGQMAGNIAVRIETPAASPMTDLDSFGDEMGNPDSMMALPDDIAPIDQGHDAVTRDDMPMGVVPDAFDPAPMSDDLPMGDLPMAELPIGDMPMEGLPDLPMADFPDFPSEES